MKSDSERSMKSIKISSKASNVSVSDAMPEKTPSEVCIILNRDSLLISYEVMTHIFIFIAIDDGSSC